MRPRASTTALACLSAFLLGLDALSPSSAAAVVALLLLLRWAAWDEAPLAAAFSLGEGFYAASTGHQQRRRRFVVTGAGSGVGRRMVGAVVRRGHAVVALDVNAAAREDAWDLEAVTMLRADVTREQDWEQAVVVATRKLGGVDVLMNVAGYLKPASTVDVTPRDIHMHIDVNVKGVMLGTVAFARLMAKQVASGELPCGGHIVNFSSLGAIAPVSGVGLYIGSKAACRSFSLCAAKDLAPLGVFVTAVCPDAIQTPMVDLQLHYKESSMAFSGGILTLDDVEEAIFSDVLPNRPREVLLPTSVVRGKMARLADVFSGTLVIAWAEAFMRARGEREQAKRTVAGGGGVVAASAAVTSTSSPAVTSQSTSRASGKSRSRSSSASSRSPSARR